MLVLLEAGGAAVALAFQHAGAERQAVEIVRVQVAIVVDVWNNEGLFEIGANASCSLNIDI